MCNAAGDHPPEGGCTVLHCRHDIQLAATEPEAGQRGALTTSIALTCHTCESLGGQ